MEYYEFKKEDAYEFARASRIQTKQRGDELQFLSCPYCRGGKNGDKGKLGECAAVLVNTATDTEVPAQIRVNAANAALSQCSQWTKNVDMIERLEAMEELMSRVEQEQKSQRRRT